MNLIFPSFSNKFLIGLLPYLLFFLIALGLTNAARYQVTTLPTGDEVHILVASWSLAKDGDFDLRNQYDSDFLPLRLPDRAVMEVDGKQYPQLSLFDSVLFWAPAKLAISLNGGINEFLKFVKIQMNLIWSLVATLLFLSLCKNKFNPIIAFISSISLVAFFPGILYASSASADSLGGVIFTLCLVASTIMSPSKVYLNLTLGLLSGLLVVVHPRFFPIALVIFLLSVTSLSLITHNLKRTFFLFLISFALPICIQTLLNYSVYPEPSPLMAIFGPTGPHFKKIISLEMGITSLPFTLFDGWHGLIAVAPFSIPAVIGLFRDRKNILISKVILLLICAYLVIIGTNPDARGNGFYLGGRYFIVFLGCVWWGFALYLQQLTLEWGIEKGSLWNKRVFIIPLVALLILSALLAISTYYSYRSDGFSAAGKSYGDYSSIFPLFFTDPNSKYNFVKAFYFLIYALIIATMLVSRKIKGVFASVVLFISLPFYLYINHHIDMVRKSNFKTSINFQNAVLETEPNAGKFSNDYHVYLPWEGEYAVDYNFSAHFLSEPKVGSNIGQCDAIRYLGKDFSPLTVKPLLSGFSLKPGTNTISTKFYYDGVGPVFLRCYIATPMVTLELFGANVSFNMK